MVGCVFRTLLHVREAAHDTRTALQAECTRLQAECAQLRSKARPCTTCDGADGQGPEDDCPAELAAALQRLQLAEDYITELSTSYDSLRDITLEKLTERDAKLASALSALRSCYSLCVNHLLAEKKGTLVDVEAQRPSVTPQPSWWILLVILSTQ